MDKTFAETQGKPAFDWIKALNNPPKACSEEHIALAAMARSWVTCACGNQCAIIPRRNIDGVPGSPLDKDLRDLGVVFYTNVRMARWGEAKTTIIKIEARAEILIKEELAKLNQ